MTIQFAPKTATLVTNVQNTLTWGLSEFSATLGQSNGIIRSQISLSFQVTNNTAQVCYIGLRYDTIKNSFNIGEKKSIAAVPANSSLNITPLNVPSLAVLGPDITSIAMTLISAASGNVTVSLNADDPRPEMAGGSNLFGLDDRSIRDYIPVPASGFFNLASGIPSPNLSTLYTVPAGKRAQIKYMYLSVCPTAAFIADAGISAQVNDALNIFKYFLGDVKSRSEQYNSLAVSFVDLWMESGERLIIDRYNTSSAGIINNVYAFVINESF